MLLTDMRMPYMGGAELAHQLRGRRRTLKLLCISGYPGQPRRRAGDRFPRQAVLPRRPSEEGPRSPRQVARIPLESGHVPQPVSGRALARGLLLAALPRSRLSAAAPSRSSAWRCCAATASSFRSPSFDGKGWSVPWPGSDTSVPLPISLGDIPKKWWGAVGPDAPWTAWLPDEVKRAAEAGQARRTCRCSAARTWRLPPTIAASRPTEREPTVPKDGIAIAGDVTIQPIIAGLGARARRRKRVIAADHRRVQRGRDARRRAVHRLVASLWSRRAGARPDRARSVLSRRPTRRRAAQFPDDLHRSGAAVSGADWRQGCGLDHVRPRLDHGVTDGQASRSSTSARASPTAIAPRSRSCSRSGGSSSSACRARTSGGRGQLLGLPDLQLARRVLHRGARAAGRRQAGRRRRRRRLSEGTRAADAPGIERSVCSPAVPSGRRPAGAAARPARREPAASVRDLKPSYLPALEGPRERAPFDGGRIPALRGA